MKFELLELLKQHEDLIIVLELDMNTLQRDFENAILDYLFARKRLFIFK